MAQAESIRTYFAIFLALLVLTGLTVGAAFIDFGVLSTPIALFIALVKGYLVVWYFMHVRHGSSMLKLFALAGFYWLIIIMAGTLKDYISRAWEDFPQDHAWVIRTSDHLKPPVPPKLAGRGQ